MRISIKFLLVFLVIISCKKNKNNPAPVTNTHNTTDSNNTNYDDNPINEPTDTPTIFYPTAPKDTFITYLIKKGNNYCDGNTYPAGTWDTLRFRAILDSSCIYTTVLPENQLDINKLYGVSDCSAFHQVNSARFGWNWVGGAMRIHAYCYSNSARNYKELGTVEINKPFECKLTVLPDKYLFELMEKLIPCNVDAARHRQWDINCCLILVEMNLLRRTYA